VRHALAAASLLAVLAACSSSTDGDECSPVGTYSMTGTVESTTCNVPAGDGKPTTVQVALAPAGTDAEYAWSFAGATGQCGLKKVPGSACKLEGRCPITITDATTSDNQAQILISWSFTAGGFEGVSTFTAPPFTDHPDGCVQTVKNAATRR
jgi:hypothetical protein